MKPDNYESNALLGLAATLSVGGLTFFLIVLISGLRTLPERLPSQQFPGSITLEFQEEGKVTVFVESEGPPEAWDRAELHGLFESLIIKVVGPDGKEIESAFPQSDMSYNFRARKGRALAVFPAPLEGAYEVSVEYQKPGVQQTHVLSFGLNFGTVLLRLVLTSFLAFAFPLGLAVLVGIAAMKKRRFAPPDRSVHQNLRDRFQADVEDSDSQIS